ncbi:MAG: penicillin-binding protein [Propionibacteriaceae bacterium]|jgi:membrane peptidoglycan carboxypeptidase|nr:penicillin-binding protein [Propionibacteriaceae bacterium]
MAKTPKRARTSTANPKKKRPLPVRILKWFGIAIFFIFVIGCVALAALWTSVTVPDPNEGFQTNTTTVYWNDGKSELGTFEVQNRTTIPYAEIPQYAKDALVASENRSFWTDPGFDIPSMFRAGLGILTGDQVTGGSTITQQYVKVFYLTQDRTITRKVEEIILAAKIGQSETKEEILANYLNTVYFGRGAYGIEAAADAYFQKHASELTLAEATELVTIINNPSALDPANGSTSMQLERYQYALKSMEEMGYITQAQRLEVYWALPEMPEYKVHNRFGGTNGYLLKYVEEELKSLGFTEGEINGGGLDVITTFSKKDQAALVKSVNATKKQMAADSGKKQSFYHPAATSIDNTNGEVIAMYGGTDYVKQPINWATTPRPVGSTMKPYALAAALKQGWALNDTVNGNSFTPPGAKQPIRNAGGGNYGQVTLLRATTGSINSAYVDLTLKMDDGPQSIREAANAAGVPDGPGWEEPTDTFALGYGEISTLSQAQGYSTFANYGIKRTAHTVRKVLDMNGVEKSLNRPEDTQALERDVAQDVTYALTKVAQDGTGSRATALGYPVAGKTGTRWVYVPEKGIQETTAVWFVGFTKQITTAVMLCGGEDGATDMGSIFGAGYPATIWLGYMETAMEGMDREYFLGQTDRRATHNPYTPSPTPTPTPTPTPEPEPEPEPEPTEPTDIPPTTAPPTTEVPPEPVQPSTEPPPPVSAPAPVPEEPHRASAAPSDAGAAP